MNILFSVCGRAGSKGLKNKNLKNFLGKPLVHHTLAAIKFYKEKYGGDKYIRVCLNTDSEALIDSVYDYMPDVFVIRRDESLAGDTVSKMAVIKDCLHKTEENDGIQYDMVVDLDITSPLRTVDDIKNVIDKKTANSLIDVIFSVTDSRRNPYFNMVKKNTDDSWSKVIDSSHTARQQAPEIMDMNASIYAWKSDFLKNNTSHMLFDGKCDVIKMMDTAILDIDSEEDFELMEILATHFISKYKEFEIILRDSDS